MRIYSTFGEALNEIRRDLAEMGVKVHPQTMQDKYVADDENYSTLELQNYSYMVLDPVGSLGQLDKVNADWAFLEFEERTNGSKVNPGQAYLQRLDVWSEFLHDGKFAYTYSERIGDQLEVIISELILRPDSRQLWLSIWDPNIDNLRMGSNHRVPCSLGYLFQMRNGQLNITYVMRSCDFATHFQNDAFLATKLMAYVAARTGLKPGYFTHQIGSFHIYQKDVEGVF